MSIFKSKSVILCSLIGGLAVLSGCSDNDPADVSFEQIDTTGVPANIIPNADLSESDTEWTGWSAEVDETDSAVSASFDLAPTLGEGGNSLQTSVANVEVEAEPGDIYAGPSAVTVKPGQAYGVAAYVQGPACGLTRFIVNPVGNTNPENYLAEENIFLTGEPQMVEFHFQAPANVSSVDMPVQMGFADNIGGEFYIDRMVAMPVPRLPPRRENNVANNSDFEESDTAINVDGSWAQSGAGVTFTIDKEHVQNGNNSVKIVFDSTVGSGDAWAIEAGPVGVEVVPGWTYVFSAWIKGSPGAKANFLVQNPTEYNTYGDQEVIVTSEWQEVRFEVEITDTDVVRLYTQYNFPENQSKTIYIDNIKLIPPDTCPYAPPAADAVSGNEALFEYNHVTNESLEDELLEISGWETFTQNGGAAQFDMQVVLGDFNRTLVNKGNQSLKTHITATTANPADIQAGPAGIYVTPGQTYIYSGFARGAAGTKAQFTSSLSGAPTLPMEELVVTFNNVWQQVSFDFTVPDNAPTLTVEELEEAGFPDDALVSHLNMTVNMSYAGNEGKAIFLDDFVLLPNPIRNGDLEDSATTAEGWDWVAPEDLATVALDTTDAHSGNNSLKVSFSGNATNLADPKVPTSFIIQPDDVQAGVENIPVFGGRRYFVSARVNGEAGSRLKLTVTSADGSKELASSAGGATGVELAGGWQEITFAANVPEGTEAVNLIAEMGYPTNALRTINLDTFRLVSQIPPVPAAKANLVNNGDFETGLATGWSESGASMSVVDSTQNPDGVYSGRYALYVDQRQGAWASAQFDLGENGLVAGTNYFASAWVKLNSSDGGVADKALLKVRVDYSDNTSDYLSIAESADDADTFEWTRLSSVFTFNPAPGKTISSIKPYVETFEDPAREANHTSYYVDDLFITKVFNTNGGFESGMEGWSPAGANVMIVEGAGRSQTNAARISDRIAGWSSLQYGMGDIGLIPGRTYLLSAWVKWDSTDAPEDIKMTVEQADEAGNANRWRTIARTTNAADWVQLSNTFTYLPTGDLTTLQVYFEATGLEAEGAGGTYFVDDLIITEVALPPTLITNGNLENGTTDGWVGAGATIAVEQWPQGGAQSGFFGLRVSGRTMSWNSAQYPLLELGWEPNSSYKASVWVKFDGDVAATDTFKLTFNYTDGGGQHWITVAQANIGGGVWTKLEGIFDYAPIGPVTDMKLYVEAAGLTTSYFLDDLVVVRNFAFNGGLEASAANFTAWSPAGATMSLDSATKQSGERSLFVTGRTDFWNSAQYDLTNSGMVPGKTYDISAWVKIDGDTLSVIKMTLESKTAVAQNSTYTFLDGASDTADWVKLSRRYTFAYDEMPATFKVYFEADERDENNNPPPFFSSYYVDSLVITEVEETYTH